MASGHGLVSAQNMMYTHTVTFYDGDGTLAATVDDAVDLAAFGIDGHPGTSQGAPVEAAFTADGRHAYISNYSMYGAGFGPEGSDSCTPDTGVDESFVYRVDTTTFAIDQVIAVGAVPKYVAVTPDGATVLVTNWCTWDLSIIDVATATEVARVPIGRYPRDRRGPGQPDRLRGGDGWERGHGGGPGLSLVRPSWRPSARARGTSSSRPTARRSTSPATTPGP